MSDTVQPSRRIAPVAKAIAELGFEQRPYQIDQEMATYILQREDFAEINAYFINACGISLEQTINAIWPHLNVGLIRYLRKSPLTDSFKLGLLYADLNQELKPAILKKIRDKIPIRGKEFIILDCVRAFQDYWVSLHEDDFSNPANEHLLYKFMPYQMIGIAEVQYIIRLLMPIFHEIGLTSPGRKRFYQKTVEQLGELTPTLYRQEQELFKTQCSINSSPESFRRSFEALYRRGFLYSVTIHNTISSNDFVIDQLYAQVADHNPGVFCQRPPRPRKKN